MWNFHCIKRIDLRSFLIVILVMMISLLVIAATTQDNLDFSEPRFFTRATVMQLQWFFLGWIVYFLCAGLDYHYLRQWTWVLYFFTVLSLFGLFFTTPIQNVRRWYRIPGIGREFQPSEYAKLVMVMALSWFLEKQGRLVHTAKATLQAIAIVFVPFVLILKQPDLGSALVLYPTALVMFYLGGVRKGVVQVMGVMGACGLVVCALFFSGIISHEAMRPYVTKVIKEYQYERLNPQTYHQKAATTAIALGGATGTGWARSEFTGRKWLPAAHTDSVFAAFAEEFGLIGVLVMLLLFFGLIYFSFQVTVLAKDRFGRLLAAGITAYFAIHVILNMGMMCGLLPITGVPLPLVTYGGSSMLATMGALGILQSIYSRRFMF
jgi:rod shape determining protein RodA